MELPPEWGQDHAAKALMQSELAAMYKLMYCNTNSTSYEGPPVLFDAELPPDWDNSEEEPWENCDDSFAPDSVDLIDDNNEDDTSSGSSHHYVFTNMSVVGTEDAEVLIGEDAIYIEAALDSGSTCTLFNVELGRKDVRPPASVMVNAL